MKIKEEIEIYIKWKILVILNISLKIIGAWSEYETKFGEGGMVAITWGLR